MEYSIELGTYTIADYLAPYVGRSSKVMKSDSAK